MVQIKELVGLRGVLAWWVVAGHLAYVFSQRVGELSFNRSAVDVFIVLSGFVIMSLLDSKREAFRPYIVRRFMRLFPIYLVILLVSAATLGAQQYGLASAPFETERTAGRIAALEAAQQQIFLHLAAHLPMLHGLVPTALISKVDTSIIGQAWSISVEWQFYLLAPLIFWGLVGSWRARATVACGALALFALSKVGPLSSNDAFIGGSIGWFAIGIFSYFGFKAREYSRPLLLMTIGAVGLAVFGVAVRSPGAVLWSGVMLWLVGRVPAIIQRAATAAFANPVAMVLGNISYSTYVVHMLVIYLSMALLNWLSITPGIYVPALITMTVTGTAALSFLGYYFVEKPGIDFGTQLARVHDRGLLSRQTP
jgi:peptidoglycan/LPS O-acetylase OafA/YrhL